MTRILAAVSVVTVLTAGVGALAAAESASGSDAQLLDDTVGIFAHGIDIAALVQFVLVIALFLGVLGVIGGMSR